MIMQQQIRIITTKKGYEDISVYLGGDIRSEIDEIEKFYESNLNNKTSHG